MQWANPPDTKVGDLNFFIKYNGVAVIVESSAEGVIELSSGKSERMWYLYEEMQRQKDTSFYEDAQEIRTNEGADSSNLQYGTNRGNVIGNSGSIGEERFQIESEGNNEYLRTGDKGKPINRFSRQMSSSARKLLDSSPELTMIFKLQQETKLSEGYIPESKRITDYARKLKKDNESTLSVPEIERDLRDIYEVLSNVNSSEGYEYASELTYSLAEKLVSNSKVLDDLNAEKKDLRQRLTQYLKGRKWYLSPDIRSEIEYYYDTYGNFYNNRLYRFSIER